MRTFSFNAAIVIVCALALAIVVVHSLVYLSIDPNTLSAEVPSDEIKPDNANTRTVLIHYRN